MFYVVDTNVWLLKPDFYESYRDGVVVIPTTVIQELDKHKGSFGVLGTNARLAARLVSRVAAGLTKPLTTTKTLAANPAKAFVTTVVAIATTETKKPAKGM